MFDFSSNHLHVELVFVMLIAARVRTKSFAFYQLPRLEVRECDLLCSRLPLKWQTVQSLDSLDEFFFLRWLPRKRRRAFVCTSLSRDYNISGVYSARHCLLPSCEILIFLCSAHTECSRRFDCLCAKHIIYFLINKLNIGKLFPASWRHFCVFFSRRATMLAERGRLILDCWNFSQARSFFTKLKILKNLLLNLSIVYCIMKTRIINLN